GRRAAHVARRSAGERVPARRAAPGADPGAGAGRCPGEPGRPLPRPAHPGGGAVSGPDELIHRTAPALAGLIRTKEVSAVEVAQAHLDRIAEVDGSVHAFLHVAAEAALESAALVDAAAEPASPLAGVPLALKDVFTTTDMPTTAGS